MKKAIILLLFSSIMLFGLSSCSQSRKQKQPATKEETIEALQKLLPEYGFASNQKNWKMEIDECSITVEYENDGRKYRIVYPTYDIDKIELEETETIYVIHYNSDIAIFTDFADDDEPWQNQVPFMHVSVPVAKDQLKKMLQQLGDSCAGTHTRYHVVHGLQACKNMFTGEEGGEGSGVHPLLPMNKGIQRKGEGLANKTEIERVRANLE